MKEFIRRDFISWKQPFTDKRAIALVEGGWFMEAINCFRDGDMGKEGDDGVMDRIWYADQLFLYDDDEYDYRPASPKEVSLYLKHCSLDWHDNTDVFAIVRGDESYVLYEKKEDKQ